MWDIDYKIENKQVIAIITVADGFVVDNGRTQNGEEVNYHIYTATRGGAPSQQNIKRTPFHLDDIHGKPLELQLMESGTKRKIKKTRENVSSAKKK